MRPEYSIIIPVRNRAGLTRGCLDAVLTEPPRRPFEVIVVDDGSNDATQAVLDAYGDAIRVLRRRESGGFAHACNNGAAAAKGKRLVFLNNDTRPEPGWLDALAAYADAHPQATIVGARLVWPNGRVQHAGVVIGCDGYPHHLYAGFPADHPGVTKSRRFQAVTAACALVRRGPFEDVGGFDPGFRNSLEDVDLCLRLGNLGHEIHYCHQAVIGHLESASRGHTDRFAESVDLYRERWRDRVRTDDIHYYLEDGLLDFEYGDAYPLRLSLSPLLGVVAGDSRAHSEHMLDVHSRQVIDLLREVVRLTAHVADLELGWTREGTSTPSGTQARRKNGGADREEFVRRVRKIELELAELQRNLASAARRPDTPSPRPAPAPPGFQISPYLDYRRVIEGVREAVERAVPPDATVVVLSRGDPELLDLGGREVWHFPREPGGGYAGSYPANGDEAVGHLQKLEASGARYVVLPATSRWWLDAYPEFGERLAGCSRVAQTEACSIFCLNEVPEMATVGRRDGR